MRIDSEASAVSAFQAIAGSQAQKSEDSTGVHYTLASLLRSEGEDAQPHTPSFASGRTLSEEEQRRLMELEKELTAMLGEAPEDMTEDRQRRIREIEQEISDITGVKMPVKGRVAQVANWMKKDESQQEEQARKDQFTDQQFLAMEADEVRQWRLDQLSRGIETPAAGEGLLSFIQRNAAAAYARQASQFSSSGTGSGFSGA